jgi:hypothetical protein
VTQSAVIEHAIGLLVAAAESGALTDRKRPRPARSLRCCTAAGCCEPVPLLDHLVGLGKHCQGDFDSEKLGCLEVYTRLNLVGCSIGRSAGRAPSIILFG